MRLPLGIHHKSGRRCYFVTLKGEPGAPSIRDQVRLLASPDRVPEAFVQAVLARAPASSDDLPLLAFEPPEGPQDEQPAGEPLSERLKKRISGYDFVRRCVELDRQGRGIGPFHNDLRASFSVDEAHNF